MNSQSPIYSLKFTIVWIFIYVLLIIMLFQILNIFISIYIGLWILNLFIEIVERLFLRYGKRIITVENKLFLDLTIKVRFNDGRLAQSGRALARQARGHKFKSCISHKYYEKRSKVSFNIYSFSILYILTFFFRV